MNTKPEIFTKRLKLRILQESDRESLRQGANHREIADTMISVPFPFETSHAIEWIERAETGFKKGKEFHFGILKSPEIEFIGYVTLRELDREHSQAELSFWVTSSEWGQGYATEACAAIIKFGFETLQVNRIYAFHMLRNPGSGKVLDKLGLVKEGLLRECVIKWGKFEDVVIRAILRKDWN